MDTPFDLTGKIAIVTGAARGLGFAIADALATAGARVMMSDAAGDAGQAACDGLAERGLDLGFERCDVTRAEELYALVARTVRAFGGLDILVANAGISDRMKGSSSGDMDDYARVLDVNLTSAVRLCALAVPHLKARGGGSIILMASLAGLRGNSRLGPYALSKAALAQFARNLAVDRIRYRTPELSLEELDATQEPSDGYREDAIVDQIRRLEQVALIRRAMESLSASDREILALAYDRQMTSREIMGVTGKPSISAVTTHVYQAMKRLRILVRSAGEAAPSFKE